jgi:methyl-accepting chemotaxis protein
LIQSIQQSATESEVADAMEDLKAVLENDTARLNSLNSKLRQMVAAFEDDTSDGNEAADRAVAVVQQLASGGSGRDALVTCTSSLKKTFATLKGKYCSP